MKNLLLLSCLAAGCGGNTLVHAEGTCPVTPDTEILLRYRSSGTMSLRNLGPSAIEFEIRSETGQRMETRSIPPGSSISLVLETGLGVVRTEGKEGALLRYDLVALSGFPSVEVESRPR